VRAFGGGKNKKKSKKAKAEKDKRTERQGCSRGKLALLRLLSPLKIVTMSHIHPTYVPCYVGVPVKEAERGVF
jgi:hypothetical protein